MTYTITFFEATEDDAELLQQATNRVCRSLGRAVGVGTWETPPEPIAPPPGCGPEENC